MGGGGAASMPAAGPSTPPDCAGAAFLASAANASTSRSMIGQRKSALKISTVPLALASIGLLGTSSAKRMERIRLKDTIAWKSSPKTMGIIATGRKRMLMRERAVNMVAAEMGRAGEKTPASANRTMARRVGLICMSQTMMERYLLMV